MNCDLSKFEPPKAEPDGYTKKLFGMPCKKETKMEEIQRSINEQIRLVHEDQDKFIFETIRTYTDGVLAHEGIIKIPKKLLERALTCFKMEHPAEFELLLNGDEGMKQKIAEGNKSFHCGVEESGFHAYNCNDCPNKCEEYYQWDKEFRKKGEKE